MTATDETAIVAKRDDHPPVDTTEIEALTEAAGYEVVETITQVRPTDPGTHLGSGKADELADTAAALAVDLVVIDGEVTSGQARNLSFLLPDESRLIDRYRLVLELFAQRATDRRAIAQVELAQLEYQLDWFEAVAEESPLTRMNEKGSRRYQLQDRIDARRRELAELPDPGVDLRERRREAGFDLVTLAGYTNAGKSTLLRRIADDLEVDQSVDDHPDRTETVGVEDRLFKTLETTTRRATLRGRRVLCTDTVGYVRDLPHDLVISFAETLSAAGSADCVVLVTDATDDAEHFEAKLDLSLDILEHQGVDRERLIPVVNKIDLVDSKTVTARLAQLRQGDHDPVAISASSGLGIDQFIDRLLDLLPTDEAALTLPYTDEAMALVSTAYDTVSVEAIEYDDDRIHLTIVGRPEAVRAMTDRARALGVSTH